MHRGRRAGKGAQLRKASPSSMLNGATAPELMAWLGWKTIGEVQRSIEEANRIRLPKNAGARLVQNRNKQAAIPVSLK